MAPHPGRHTRAALAVTGCFGASVCCLHHALRNRHCLNAMACTSSRGSGWQGCDSRAPAVAVCLWLLPPPLAPPLVNPHGQPTWWRTHTFAATSHGLLHRVVHHLRSSRGTVPGLGPDHHNLPGATPTHQGGGRGERGAAAHSACGGPLCALGRLGQAGGSTQGEGCIMECAASSPPHPPKGLGPPPAGCAECGPGWVMRRVRKAHYKKFVAWHRQAENCCWRQLAGLAGTCAQALDNRDVCICGSIANEDGGRPWMA
jgi:hypothetical protein